MELKEEMETQKQIAECERLRAEVKIREREDLSDYESSDEDCDDVTQPKKTATKTLGFQ